VRARLARLALALYPLAYRRRYGDEMTALIEDSEPSSGAVIDLLRGAVRAHLRPEPAVAGEVGADDRRRLGLSAVLLCWILFSAAGLGLYKTTESRSFEGGIGGGGVLHLAHLAIQVLAGLASLAVVLGATPLVLAALRQGRERPAARHATRLACACVATFVAATVALVVIAAAALGLSAGVEALVLAAWSLLALACGVGCALAARRGLFAIAVPRRALDLATGCAALVAVAMAAIVVLAGVYLVALLVGSPELAGEPNGPLGVPSAAVSLAIQLAAMFTFALPAGLGARRALAAR
jgi:hypothetical protein